MLMEGMWAQLPPKNWKALILSQTLWRRSPWENIPLSLHS